MSPWVNCFQWRLVTFHRNNKQIPWGRRETPFVFFFFFFFSSSSFFSSSFLLLLLLLLLLLVLVLQFIRNLALLYYCPPLVPILWLSPPISNIRYLHTFFHLIQPPNSLPTLLVLSSTVHTVLSLNSSPTLYSSCIISFTYGFPSVWWHIRNQEHNIGVALSV